MSTGEELSYEVTLKVRDTCLCLHLQRAARALARRFDTALRAFDLTNGQFSLLMSLNRPEPASMGNVASLLAMDRTTLTAAIKPLERRGLLNITIDPNDRRHRHLSSVISVLRPASSVLQSGLAAALFRRDHNG